MGLKGKKGAIEFSLTTILVIIIGIIVLSLAINWVRTTFRGVSGITDEAIASAQTVFADIGGGKVRVPATISIAPGETRKIQVAVRNELAGAAKTFKLKGVDELAEDITVCNLISRTVTTSGASLQSGEEGELLFALQAPSGTTPASCQDGETVILKVPVVYDTADTNYVEEAIVVNIRA